ncbi:MAG TPA: penicillin-binding protein 2, partial [Streptosporangiaceae bacterium]|nr:penicillin-binding protein 2 [Streptosporangiaceae bacterium]
PRPPPRPVYVRPPRPRRLIPRGNPARRLGVTLLAIVFVLTLFAARLVQLQGLEAGRYRVLALLQREKPIALPAVRGTITGANGEVLAMTVATYLVYADPPQMPAADQAQVATKLAAYLSMPADQILSLIQHPTSPQYVVLAKGVSAQTGDAIQALNLPGISLTATYARTYPDGDTTANVVGFTGTNQGTLTGAAGIEQEYNSLLAGRAGSEQVQIGTNGQQIPLAGSSDRQVVNGSDLRLTIVPALQYDAEQACAAQVAKSKASNCTVVIIQPKTGHVLAMAQWPTYDPSTITDVGQASNIAVQNEFQPGSTAKVITAAAAFEHGGQTPMSAYNIPYQIDEGGQLIHDAEWSPGERYTIAGIIAHSSNVGISQVAAHITPQVQYDYLRAFGLGQPSGLGLPGETPGELPPVSQWWPDTRYTLAFGQGVAVTAIQMAEVYATIANDGVRVQPTLVEGTTDSAGKYAPAAASPAKRVIQAKTAQELRQILEQVPAIDQEGGQPWGIIPGYAIAAKTGTSQESNGTCALCVYGSSYIGMAPGNDPQLVIAVNVQNPRKGGYYGDVVAGPVFYQVMKEALATLQIPPDGATPANIRLNAP